MTAQLALIAIGVLAWIPRLVIAGLYWWAVRNCRNGRNAILYYTYAIALFAWITWALCIYGE